MTICTIILGLLAPDLARTAPQSCAAIVRESRDAGVDVAYVAALAWDESRLSMTARSPGGHVGPLQVSGGVLRRYGGKKKNAVRAGVRYFGQMVERWGAHGGVCRYQGWRDCSAKSRGMKAAAAIVTKAETIREALELPQGRGGCDMTSDTQSTIDARDAIVVEATDAESAARDAVVEAARAIYCADESGWTWGGSAELQDRLCFAVSRMIAAERWVRSAKGGGTP